MLVNPNVMQKLSAQVQKSSLIVEHKTLANADEAAKKSTIEFYCVVKPENIEEFSFDDPITAEPIKGESMRVLAFDNAGTEKEVLMVFTALNRGVVNTEINNLRKFAKTNVNVPLHVTGAFGKTDLTKGKFYAKTIALVTDKVPTAGLKINETPEPAKVKADEFVMD